MKIVYSSVVVQLFVGHYTSMVLDRCPPSGQRVYTVAQPWKSKGNPDLWGGIECGTPCLSPRRRLEFL
jgi:hypothetical protein